MSTGDGFDRSAFSPAGWRLWLSACGSHGPSAVTQRAPFSAMAGLSTRASGGMRGSFYEPRRTAFGRTWIRGFLKRQALGAKEKVHDDGR
jgi:hypothetical protein